MKSSIAEEAEAAEDVGGVASCRRGLTGEERGGRMVGWGCQQRKEEEIRLEFWFMIRCLMLIGYDYIIRIRII